VTCTLKPEKLPWPISEITSAKYFHENEWESLRADTLSKGGENLTIPSRGVLLLYVR
jgi:hypothetical protein